MRQEADGWYSKHVAVLVTAPYFENLYALAPRRTRLPDGREGLVFELPLGEAGRWPLSGGWQGSARPWGTAAPYSARLRQRLSGSTSGRRRPVRRRQTADGRRLPRDDRHHGEIRQRVHGTHMTRSQRS